MVERQFSRLLAAELCGISCSNAGYTVFRGSVKGTGCTMFRGSVKGTGYTVFRGSVKGTGCTMFRGSVKGTGCTMFRGNVKGTGYPLHSPVNTFNSHTRASPCAITFQPDSTFIRRVGTNI